MFRLSVAKRHGLIEAASWMVANTSTPLSYPWQNATASLKLRDVYSISLTSSSLSVAKRHGLIEASIGATAARASPGLSVAKRHGLIEAGEDQKNHPPARKKLSVAKRHGLIEAMASLSTIEEGGSVIRGKTPRPH